MSNKVIVAKDGFSAIGDPEPSDLKFSSDYGTLKYFTKQDIAVEIDGGAGDWAGQGSYTHDLGYYPYVEVYVAVGVGSHGTNYEYCPFNGSGASVFYSAGYSIKTDKIWVYGEFNGVSLSTWYFDFKVFIFQNDLKL